MSMIDDYIDWQEGKAYKQPAYYVVMKKLGRKPSWSQMNPNWSTNFINLQQTKK